MWAKNLTTMLFTMLLKSGVSSWIHRPILHLFHSFTTYYRLDLSTWRCHPIQTGECLVPFSGILYFWCMNTELTEWSSSNNTCISSMRHITDFGYIGAIDSTSALGLKDLLNSKIIKKKKKTKIWKTCTNQTVKRTLVYCGMNETRR